MNTEEKISMLMRDIVDQNCNTCIHLERTNDECSKREGVKSVSLGNSAPFAHGIIKLAESMGMQIDGIKRRTRVLHGYCKVMGCHISFVPTDVMLMPCYETRNWERIEKLSEQLKS